MSHQGDTRNCNGTVTRSQSTLDISATFPRAAGFPRNPFITGQFFTPSHYVFLQPFQLTLFQKDASLIFEKDPPPPRNRRSLRFIFFYFMTILSSPTYKRNFRENRKGEARNKVDER